MVHDLSGATPEVPQIKKGAEIMTWKERDKLREHLCEEVEVIEGIVDKLKACYEELEVHELFDIDDAERRIREIEERISEIDNEEYDEFVQGEIYWLNHA